MRDSVSYVVLKLPNNFNLEPFKDAVCAVKIDEHRLHKMLLLVLHYSSKEQSVADEQSTEDCGQQSLKRSISGEGPVSQKKPRIEDEAAAKCDTSASASGTPLPEEKN